jgi:hypothetical protein
MTKIRVSVMPGTFFSKFKLETFYILILSFVVIQVSLAAEKPEPLIEDLHWQFKKEYLNLGLLIQAVGDFQVERSFPGNNGFSIANFRLIISGELDGKFGYLLHTNFISGFSILDAKIYYKYSPHFILDVGQFKSPFSKEFLTGAESITFVNRSRIIGQNQNS